MFTIFLIWHTSITKGAYGASGQFLKLSLITLRRSSTLCESWVILVRIWLSSNTETLTLVLNCENFDCFWKTSKVKIVYLFIADLVNSYNPNLFLCLRVYLTSSLLISFLFPMFNYQFRFVKATDSVLKAPQCVPSALSAKSSLVTLILSWLLNVVTHSTAPASHNGLGNI